MTQIQTYLWRHWETKVKGTLLWHSLHLKTDLAYSFLQRSKAIFFLQKWINPETKKTRRIRYKTRTRFPWKEQDLTIRCQLTSAYVSRGLREVDSSSCTSRSTLSSVFCCSSAECQGYLSYIHGSLEFSIQA